MRSQVISAHVYNEVRNELTVTFASGRTPVYWLVPPAVYSAFVSAGARDS